MKLHAVMRCAIAGMIPLLAGCAHYYKVNDPAGGKEYYTTKVDQTRAGSVKIKDAKTGATVTLQSSEVKEISEEEYEAALKTPAPVVPAATPALAAPVSPAAPPATPAPAPPAATPAP